MRLHKALEHIRSSRYRSMEPWGAGEIDSMARYIRSHAAETIEFTFDFFDPTDAGDTLQTFIGFADELWDNEIAPIPHNFFWVSWVQRILDHNVKMAAFCERVHSPTDQSVVGLSVRSIFENARGDGFAFINQLGHMIVGDHKNVVISHADNDSSGLLVDNAFGVVKGLLGALATPQAIRRNEPAPLKLNRQRAKKGKETIRPVIVIDIRATQHSAAARRAAGGYSVRPHWRRGHIRHLPNGRVVGIPPACVNMETGVAIKPEYLIKA